jgi:hypothetical protein
MRFLLCLLVAGCAVPLVQIGSTTQPAFMFELEDILRLAPGSVQVPITMESGAVQVPVAKGAISTPPIPESTSFPLGIALLIVGFAVAGGIVYQMYRRQKRNGKNNVNCC